MPTATPESAGFPTSQQLQKIDAVVVSEIERQRMPDAVVAPTSNGKLVDLNAFGRTDPMQGQPIGTDTLFMPSACAAAAAPHSAVMWAWRRCPASCHSINDA